MSPLEGVETAVARGMDAVVIALITTVTQEDGTNATDHNEVMEALNEETLQLQLGQTIIEFTNRVC